MPQPTTTSYNPEVPVYEEPENEFQEQKGSEVKPVEDYVGEKATVQGQLKGLLAQDSSYLQAARFNAQGEARKRGLLNSTMAGTAGEAAAISQAVDIAKVDAGTYAKAYGAEQGLDYKESAQNQAAKLDQAATRYKAAITGALTQQELAGKFELQKLADNAKQIQLETDIYWKELINYDNLDAQDVANITQVMGAMATEMNGSIERIWRDPNIEADAKTMAIDAVMTSYRANIETAAALANIQITWT